MIKLWYHETMRVFGDRLINNEDRAFLEDKLISMLPKLKCNKEDIITGEKIIFCDFWNGKDLEPRQYMEATSMTKLIQKIYDFQ